MESPNNSISTALHNKPALGCRKDRTNSTIKYWQSPKCLCLSSVHVGVFPTHPLLTAWKDFKRSSMHSTCAPCTPALMYQPHSSCMFLEQGVLQRNTDRRVSTPSWCSGELALPWNSAAGIPGFDAQHHGRTVMQWWGERVGLFVRLAHAIRLSC